MAAEDGSVASVAAALRAALRVCCRRLSCGLKPRSAVGGPDRSHQRSGREKAVGVWTACRWTPAPRASPPGFATLNSCWAAIVWADALATKAGCSWLGQTLRANWCESRGGSRFLRLPSKTSLDGSRKAQMPVSRWPPACCTPLAADRPEDRQPLPLLSGAAYLTPSTAWMGVNLDSARIEGTDLGNSDLSGAVLSNALATGAGFRHALLHRASLIRFQGEGADFGMAVLTLVNARNAHFAKRGSGRGRSLECRFGNGQLSWGRHVRRYDWSART